MEIKFCFVLADSLAEFNDKYCDLLVILLKHVALFKHLHVNCQHYIFIKITFRYLELASSIVIKTDYLAFHATHLPCDQDPLSYNTVIFPCFAVTESTEVQTMYFRMQAKDGVWVWLHSRGKVICKNSKKFSIVFTHCPVR